MSQRQCQLRKMLKMLFTGQFNDLLLQSAISGEQPGGTVPIFVPPHRSSDEFMPCEQLNTFLQMWGDRFAVPYQQGYTYEKRMVGNRDILRRCCAISPSKPFFKSR